MTFDTGYAAALLSRGQGLPAGGWLKDAAWVGGLSAAATAAWHGLAAFPAVRVAIAGWLAAESLFFLWSKLRFRHLSRLSESCPDTSRLELLFERFLELRDVFCIRQFLSGWFLGAPADAVLRGNVEDFVAYGFHCKLLHQLSEADQAAIRRFVDRVEAAWGVTFRPGFDPGLRFMAHVWEPLRAYHKPLALFAVTELLARVAHALMWLMGFRPSRLGGFTYWHAPALAPAPAELAGATDALSPPMSPLAAAARSPAGPKRHSTGEVVAGAVHHAAEHALDATLTVTSTAAAAVAAQHPHGGSAHAVLSPRGPSPAAPRPQSPLPALPLSGRVDGLAGAEHGAGAAAGGSRRRNKGDSAVDFADGLAAEPAAPTPVESATEEAVAPAPSSRRDVAAGRRSPLRLAPLSAAAAAAAPGSPAGSTIFPSGSVASGGTRPDVPIVFLHGVGFGVLPYLHLVRDMQQACGSTPVIMVEVPHVALRLCWEAREVDDVAHAVAAMLARHGYRRACVVGHSYGTFVASRLCQLHPELVHSACLLDPVAMLTCYPQLLYNFIYREPGLVNFSSMGGTVDLLRFMCSRDLTIAQAFCRKFHWSELMIWPQDLPRRSLIVLSGRDDLVPSELVMAHMKLTGHPAKVMHHPDLGHGGILLNPAWQARFVASLRAMLLAQR